MGPINTSSWSHSKGQIDYVIHPSKKACHPRASGVDVDAHLGLDLDVLDKLITWFYALQTQISTQSALMLE